jgi:hypothetical protein
MDDAEYLTVEEFTRRSPLSIATIRRRLKSGDLSFVQLGGKGCKILIRADELSTHRQERATSEPPESSSQPEPKPKTKPTRPTRRPNWLDDSST